MLGRCRHHPEYAGRGIDHDPRWSMFENFLADMGERPEGKSLDRKNNDKGYYKKNCRWATPKEQMRNRWCTTFLELNGEKKALTAWAEEKGIPIGTLKTRIRRGWSVKKALTT